MATLFTRILAGEIPGEVVWQDESCFVLRDINPQAPVHLLIIPREEVTGVAAVGEHGDHTRLLNAAKSVAEHLGLESWRLVINQGEDAGQTVPHLHMHLLAGRSFGWPPG